MQSWDTTAPDTDRGRCRGNPTLVQLHRDCASNTDGGEGERHTQLNSKSFAAAVSHRTCDRSVFPFVRMRMTLKLKTIKHLFISKGLFLVKCPLMSFVVCWFWISHCWLYSGRFPFSVWFPNSNSWCFCSLAFISLDSIPSFSWLAYLLVYCLSLYSDCCWLYSLFQNPTAGVCCSLVLSSAGSVDRRTSYSHWGKAMDGFGKRGKPL